jgi:hypothetical protein
VDEPASKEFVLREIAHLEKNINEKFASRDKAIELLASKAPLYIAIAGFLLALLAYLKSPH